MVFFVKKYRVITERTSINVKNAFYAADLDGNHKINLQEFLILFRNIEPNKYKLTSLLKLFE